MSNTPLINSSSSYCGVQSGMRDPCRVAQSGWFGRSSRQSMAGILIEQWTVQICLRFYMRSEFCLNRSCQDERLDRPLCTRLTKRCSKHLPGCVQSVMERGRGVESGSQQYSLTQKRLGVGFRWKIGQIYEGSTWWCIGVCTYKCHYFCDPLPPQSPHNYPPKSTGKHLLLLKLKNDFNIHNNLHTIIFFWIK